MQVQFLTGSEPAHGALLLPMLGADASHLQALDVASRGLLGRILAAAPAAGRDGAVADFYLPHGDAMRRVRAIGFGAAPTAESVRRAGAGLAAAWPHETEALHMLLPAAFDGELAASFAFGAALGAYRFDRHKTNPAPTAKRSLHLHGASPAAASLYDRLRPVADGVRFARDLVNEPPNHLTPAQFAVHCRMLERDGIEVELLDAAQLATLGMGALLGVARGSDEPPVVAVLRWRGTAAAPPLVLLGKGVTFDSGGLLPKGPEEMWDMKNDMGGAAAVAAALRVAARWRLPLDVIGILGLVENMPSGHAQRPGDVVRSLSGQTVEVLHTDAEGRLVLADLISYARQRFAPAAMVDIATLTGSVTTVLGLEYAGLFSNDDGLSVLLQQAGAATGEKVWRLPLCEGFDRMIDSPVADMQNITKQRYGGSATAAQFLHRFVGTTPWAHLDIAGVAWKKGEGPGATGFGVQLLSDLMARKAGMAWH